jgi:hypothetical protein
MTIMNMNVAIFWDTAQCNPYMNRYFGGECHLHLQGRTLLERLPLAWLIFDHEDGGDTFL